MTTTKAHHRHRVHDLWRRRRAQHGQAMTEIAIMSIVLVPLFLLVTMLGKYIHLKQMTQQAARAAAWEATVAPDYALPQRERTRENIIDRIFGQATDPIVSTPSAKQGNEQVGKALMNTFSGQALLTRSGIAMEAYGNEGASVFGDAFAGLFDDLPLPLPWTPPNMQGLVTANLSVTPDNLKTRNGAPATFLAPFDNINLRFAESHALLADAWNASGPGTAGGGARSVINQVTGLVPTALLADCSNPDPLLLPVLCPINELNQLLAPAAEVLPIVSVPTRLEIGLIEPDIVPYDKQTSAP